MHGDGTAVESKRADISPEEWQTRVELAAVYRLIHHYGWDELIYNHSAARIPGEPDKFLIKRHDALYDEVTASSLIKVDMNADLDERAGVNRPGFVLHSGVMRGRPDIACSIHVHTSIGAAVAALPSGLRMVSQSAMRYYGRIGYHDFEGITEDLDERDRIVKALGNNRVLILRTHGILTTGVHCAQAFSTLRHIMTACEIQLKVESTGQKVVDVSPELCAATARQVESAEKKRVGSDMPAYLRLLDRIDAGYRG